MRKSEKGNVAIVGAIIVALAIIGGLAYYMVRNNSVELKKINSEEVNLPAPKPTPPAPPAPVSDFDVTDSSNESIDADIEKIDAQVKNLGTDTIDIDQGLNDQPINIGE